MDPASKVLHFTNIITLSRGPFKMCVCCKACFFKRTLETLLLCGRVVTSLLVVQFSPDLHHLVALFSSFLTQLSRPRGGVQWKGHKYICLHHSSRVGSHQSVALATAASSVAAAEWRSRQRSLQLGGAHHRSLVGRRSWVSLTAAASSVTVAG